jgi:hypothetical protein
MNVKRHAFRTAASRGSFPAAIGQQTSEIARLNHAAPARAEAEKPRERADAASPQRHQGL